MPDVSRETPKPAPNDRAAEEALARARAGKVRIALAAHHEKNGKAGLTLIDLHKLIDPDFKTDDPAARRATGTDRIRIKEELEKAGYRPLKIRKKGVYRTVWVPPAE